MCECIYRKKIKLKKKKKKNYFIHSIEGADIFEMRVQ